MTEQTQKTDHRETADDYRRVVWREGRFRICECRDGIQWLFQRQRPGFPGGGTAWNTLGYCPDPEGPDAAPPGAYRGGGGGNRRLSRDLQTEGRVMAGRTFAQINCGILRSRKVGTINHAAKWAYLCVHFTPLSAFSGVFTYPSVMWAQDAALSADELNEVVTRLVAANLIEWNAEEELVRIVGFHRQRPPENASRSLSLVTDFDLLLRDHNCARDMVLRGAAEFAVAAVVRAQGWKPDSPEMPKLRETLGRFLRATYQEDGELFLDALAAEAEASSKAALQELRALFPPLLMRKTNTVPTPCRDRVGTRDIDETRPRPDENKDSDEDARAFSIATEADGWHHIGRVES